jgi:tRNA-uridine 2-sulfurtransferase
MNIKALGISSGGLDSILSALVLKEQGIYVEWVSFETPFFSAEKAKKASKMTNIPLIVKNITKQYIPMLKNPQRGYGKYMNPCMDCHALMFSIAGKIMKEKGFDFLFSGEVMGQRPMSQTKNALRYVEKHSGFDGFILRPLSARVLPETLIEKKGFADRDKLLDVQGRGRKRQIALAKEFGITDYPAPAGGCLLTDKNFSRRLKDLFKYQNCYSENELLLLKYGRHMRLNDNAKIIIGRDEKENEIIYGLREFKDILIKTETIPGPLILMPKGGDSETIKLAASICASYSKINNEDFAEVTIRDYDKSYIINTKGLLKQNIMKFII